MVATAVRLVDPPPPALNLGNASPHLTPALSASHSFPSGAGRSLRSIVRSARVDARLYAPFGAARSRALRTCGPALFMLDTSSAAARGAHIIAERPARH